MRYCLALATRHLSDFLQQATIERCSGNTEATFIYDTRAHVPDAMGMTNGIPTSPTVVITDTGFLRNPNYHEGTDTPATLDYEHMAEVVKQVYWASTHLPVAR